MNSIEHLRNQISSKGLKVTPQRMAILEAVYAHGNHPTADNIIELVRKNNPNLASGTVYKVLDTLVQKNLIKRVTTEKGLMRYDGILDKHHHLYCTECDLIEDYFDEELDQLLKDYFKNKKIEGFKFDEFVLEIRGTFRDCAEIT